LQFDNRRCRDWELTPAVNFRPAAAELACWGVVCDGQREFACAIALSRPAGVCVLRVCLKNAVRSPRVSFLVDDTKSSRGAVFLEARRGTKISPKGDSKGGQGKGMYLRMCDLMM